ncbi:MAG: hypothetical protein Q8M29_15660 [Bacteroidota bacterium]|nr:hypothetical protein [Bacteroidota bacterium]
MEKLSKNKIWKQTMSSQNTALCTPYNNCIGKPLSTDQLIVNVNKMILKTTMKIYEYYPELSKYLEEMTVTIPMLEKPNISLYNLTMYYYSLNSLLNKYILGHVKNEISE